VLLLNTYSLYKIDLGELLMYLFRSEFDTVRLIAKVVFCWNVFMDYNRKFIGVWL